MKWPPKGPGTALRRVRALLQVSRKLYARTSGNELLDLLKCAEPAQLSELTEGAGEDVLEAMNSFVQRLLGGEGLSHIESNVTELARMLFYLLVVGYTIRTMEVCCSAVSG